MNDQTSPTDDDNTPQSEEIQPTDDGWYEDIFEEDWDENHRSGIIAVIGRPNVGKSTLINAILGQKIAITTPKPQTTRRNQLGILTTRETQIIFVDTPGLHKAQTKLGDYMVTVVHRALRDVDVILWILDGSEPPQKSDLYIAEELKGNTHTPIILIVNKSDLMRGDDTTEYANLIQHHQLIRVSALQQVGIPDLVQTLQGMLPKGPRYYPVEQVSDQSMRFIAGELIREKLMNHTEQEIPHAVAVTVDSYREEGDQHYISASIFVERNSQKGIIIGKGGSMIKTIGTEARHELMTMLEATVHLDLRVKVLKNWRTNETFLKRVGYHLPKDED